MASRKEIADALKKAAGYLFFRYRYSCAFEVGVLPWGKRRADLVANKVSGSIVIVEVKSCYEDYKTDTKWPEYRHHCDKLYLCFTEDVWSKVKEKSKVPKKVGIIVLGKNGYARITRPATTLPFTPENRVKMLARLAWRAGDLSKRTKRARERIYIKE